MESRIRAKQATRPTGQQATRIRVSSLGDLLNEKLKDSIELFLGTEATTRDKKTTPTILANIGEVRIGEIDEEWVDDYIVGLRAQKTRVGRQFAYDTILNHMRIMYRICRWRAKGMKMECPTLPLNSKSFPKNWEKKRERRLHPKESKELRARLMRIGDDIWRRHWLALVDVAIETGARQQELIFAEWRELDIEEQVWIIPAQHTKCKKDRLVPLTPYCKQLFEELASICDPESSRVFHTMKSPASVSALFRKYVNEAGIIDFRFHDLRHEACARMVRAGVLPETAIMDIVGHSDIKMLRRYANLTAWELVEMLNSAHKGVAPTFGAPFRFNDGTSFKEALPWKPERSTLQIAAAPAASPAGPEGPGLS